MNNGLKTVPGEPDAVDRLKEDQVFEFSCKAAIAIQGLNESIEKHNEVVNRVMYDDDDFVSNYVQQNFCKTSTFVNLLLGFLAFGISFLICVFLTSNLAISDSPIPAIATIVIFGVLFWLLKKLINSAKRNKLRNEAIRLLPNYRIVRQRYYDTEKPEALKAIENDKNELEKITDALNRLSHSRNCLPQEYYACAGELLYLYQIKRADNLKEAINVWETIQFQIQQAEMMQEISEQIDYNRELAARAEEYARQAAYNAERAADNAETASWLSLFNYLSD